MTMSPPPPAHRPGLAGALRQRAVPLALAVLLAGCAAGPDHQPPQPQAPPDWAAWHGGAAALAEDSRRAAPWPAGLDWQVFGDPVLASLLARARDANHDLQTATLRFAQSRAQRALAASAQGPQLDARAAVARQRQSESGAATRMVDAIGGSDRAALIDALSEPFNLYQAGFDAAWELDLWGRVRRSVEAADADSRASGALLQQVQRSVQAEVARRYFELRGTQHQLRLAREDLQAGEASLMLVESRAAGGLVTQLDPARQRALLAALRERIPALQQQEAALLNQLTLLLGETPGTLNAALAGSDPAPAADRLPDLAPGLPSELAQRRPDIASAEARLHAATARIGVARADLYPRLTLGAGFGFESVGAGRFGDWGSRQWQLGPSIQLPLFDQGRRRATVELRELQQQEAAIAYQQTVLQAWHEVDSALTGYTAERQRQVQLAAQLQASQDALALAQARYRGGLTDFGVELDAQRTLLASRRALAESESRLAVALVAVYKALGV